MEKQKLDNTSEKAVINTKHTLLRYFNGLVYRLIPIEHNKDYYVSECGDVLSFKGVQPKTINYRITSCGYARYALHINGKQKDFLAHRLVSIAYVDKIENKGFVNHKDGNKLNNHYSNLEWVTHSENIRHAFDTGLKSNKGEKHSQSKVNNEIVLEMRKKFESGTTRSKLRVESGLSKSSVEGIISRRTWNHI